MKQVLAELNSTSLAHEAKVRVGAYSSNPMQEIDQNVRGWALFRETTVL